MVKCYCYFQFMGGETEAGREYIIVKIISSINGEGFPGGTVVENLPANAGDTGSSPALGRSHMPWSN